MYIDRFPDGCWVPRAKLVEEMKAKPNSFNFALRALLKMGLIREVQVVDKYKVNRVALTTSMDGLVGQAPEPWMDAPTSPAPVAAPVVAPTPPAPPAESVTAPAKQPGCTPKEFVDTFITHVAEEFGRLPARTETLVRQIDREGRADIFVSALRKVPQIMELVDSERLRAMPEPEAEVGRLVTGAAYKLFNISVSGEIHNPAGLLITRASDLRISDTDIAAFDRWHADQ
jgi:hypothetical protein